MTPQASASNDRQRRHDAERDHQRNVVFDAAPGQRDLARVLGEPGQAVGRQGERGEEQQQANHGVSASSLPTRQDNP